VTDQTIVLVGMEFGESANAGLPVNPLFWRFGFVWHFLFAFSSR
jgi:hypothetical protein